MAMDRDFDFVVRATPVPAGESGLMLAVTPEQAKWQTMGFAARRLAAGDAWSTTTADHEAALVVLGGKLTIDWGEGQHAIGKRDNVFAGLPYSVYLPRGTSYQVRAETLAEFAEIRVRADKTFKPRIIAPADTGTELRGGGDTSRQITRIIRPEADADRLMMNEVYTPDGNWSTYPPHKHDTHNLPAECDLDEIYYFRVDHPDGFALLRVYDGDGKRDSAVVIRDGDLALLRSGYHMVAAPPGYRVYYLAILAGAARSLANAIDPRYERFRDFWKVLDMRVPLFGRT